MNLNPLLLEALRSHSGSGTDPTLQALLSGSDPTETGVAIPSAQELLSQLESANPTMGLIAKYLVALRESNNESSAEAEIEAEEEFLQAGEDQYSAQVVQRLEQQVEKLRAELVLLRERNDAFAVALGACYLCWGEDPNCSICLGTGRPGSVLPDEQSFAQLIAPAIRTLQAQKEVSRPNS